MKPEYRTGYFRHSFVISQPLCLVDERDEFRAAAIAILPFSIHRDFANAVPRGVAFVFGFPQQHSKTCHGRGETEVARTVAEMLVAVDGRDLDQFALVA